MEDPDAAPPPPVMAEPDAASIEATRQVPVTTMLGPVGPLLRHSLMVSRQSLAPDLLSADAIRLLKVLCISLKDMSEDEDAGILARWWMKIVRELCYDTEDHLDGASAGHRDSSVLRSFFRPKTVGQYPSGLRAREKYEFSGLFARAKDAIKKRTYFERTTEPYWGAAGVSRPMSPDLLVPICDRTKAGVVKLPKELLELLALDDERKTLKVIPISGCAGVGKTTVARTLYHQHAGKFQCRAFVTVSQKPYTRGFLTSMLSQLKAPRPDGFPDVPDLIDAINKHLQGKR